MLDDSKPLLEKELDRSIKSDDFYLECDMSNNDLSLEYYSTILLWLLVWTELDTLKFWLGFPLLELELSGIFKVSCDLLLNLIWGTKCYLGLIILIY